MTTTETKSRDPYVRYLSDYAGQSPRGVSVFDWLKTQPRRPLHRRWYTGPIERRILKPMASDLNECLAIGTACGICKDHLVRHFHEQNAAEKFCGFLVGNELGHPMVAARGRVWLGVAGASPGGRDRGREVFVVGPDTFTLDAKAGGAAIGLIVYVENDLGSSLVGFKAAGDENPLSLAF